MPIYTSGLGGLFGGLAQGFQQGQQLKTQQQENKIREYQFGILKNEQAARQELGHWVQETSASGEKPSYLNMLDKKMEINTKYGLPSDDVMGKRMEIAKFQIDSAKELLKSKNKENRIYGRNLIMEGHKMLAPILGTDYSTIEKTFGNLPDTPDVDKLLGDYTVEIQGIEQDLAAGKIDKNTAVTNLRRTADRYRNQIPQEDFTSREKSAFGSLDKEIEDLTKNQPGQTPPEAMKYQAILDDPNASPAQKDLARKVLTKMTMIKEDTNLTEEELTSGALREKLGRQPTNSEILAEMQKNKIEQAKAGATARLEGTQRVYSEKAQRIGDAIMKGDQPPDITGFGMGALRTELLDYFSTKGFDLTSASLDYNAIKKHMGNLNSTQQLRLRQATKFAYDSLDIIEQLNEQWQAGQFPILNKATLISAKNGVLGVEAQKIATKMDTQIADMASELGTVYKGGNSSTDESLKLAAENLKSDWGYDQLLSNIELVRQNLGIRMNSLKSVRAAGVRENTIYNKGQEPPGETELKPKPDQYGFTIGQTMKGYKYIGNNKWQKQ